jgi:hypothetical protein
LDSAFEKDDLPSSTSFFRSRPRIEASEVFKFIQGMPKGGALHLHEFAITSIDWVVKDITYRDHLYSCYKNQVSISSTSISALKTNFFSFSDTNSLKFIKNRPI